LTTRRVHRRFSQVPIEKVRTYWDSRPCNIRHSAKAIGSKEYFDEVEARKYFVEPHIPGFAQFERWRGLRVLEIGCGIGTDTVNFARAGALVTATDISEESLRIAGRRAEVYGLTDRISYHLANAEELAEVIPPEPYDLVYSFGVIHHTPNPERVLDQITGHYVHPGTVVKIMVYHRYSWKVLKILLADGRGRFWGLPELIALHSEAQTGSPVTYTFSRGQLRRLLEERRLAVKQIDVEHIFPYRFSDYVEHRYVQEWHWRILPKAAFRMMEKTFGWHLCATAEAL